MSANTRKIVYLVCGLAAALIPIAAQTGLITFDQSDAWVTALASIAGGGAAVGAGVMVHKQQAEGIHDPALDPIDQVTESAKQILAQQESANAAADRLRQVTGDLLTGIPSPPPDQVQSALDSILGTP